LRSWRKREFFMSERLKGTTSVKMLFKFLTGAGAAATGVDVTGLKLQYERPGSAASSATSLTLLAALTTVFTAYGAKEVDATNSPGVYRVDVPDTAFANGADEVVITIAGTGILPASRVIDLVTLPVVTPVSATSASSIPIASAIKVAQGAKQNLIFTVTDYAGNPVNLSGLTPSPGFRFTVFDPKLPASLICQVESGEITISGGSGNIVTVAMDAGIPTTTGTYSFNLWSLETTPGASKDEQLWGQGTATIYPTNYGS
jgi:hypothetical protein